MTVRRSESARPRSRTRSRSIRYVGTGLALALAACQADGPGPDGSGAAQVDEASPAQALIAQSIDFHDPAGAWPTFAGTLVLEELRPDGSGRTAEVELDVATAGFEYRAALDGRAVVKTVAGDACDATVDGAVPTPEHVESFGLECDQMKRSRNYYLYLWGLPMKLRDPGTHVEPEVSEEDFQGQAVRAVRVTYDAEVGSDTWYFYFHPQTAALVGYRFYHDESAGDGEYITLEGLTPVGSLRLPARRRWFVNADGRFLGEDMLQGAGASM